jgi:5-hydroxyisourate hydrolase
MPGLSIHIVDVSRGVLAAGMKVELYGPERKLLASGVTNAKGLLEVDSTVPAGAYEAIFHVAAWYRSQRVALPEVAFLDVVHYHFGVADPKQHYHLPFKCTPWGYSCFRGGA